MISFTVNGMKVESESPMTLSSYMDFIRIKPETVVVEHNYEIPERNRWIDILLNDGDNLEIVKFMGGG